MTTARAAAAIVTAALLPFAALAGPEFNTQRYTCVRGVEIPATYVTTPDGSLAVLHVEGSQITLISEPAASGVRYAWPSDGSTYVWLTKGEEATLLWKTPEGETPLMTCTASG